MKQRWLICIVFMLSLLMPQTVSAQTRLPSGRPVSELSQMIENYIAENQDTTAAVSVAVFQGEETLYEGHHGQLNLETSLSAGEESVYEWGSVSKLLVWVSVMQLWEQGLIDLETDVQQYLPEGFLTKLAYDEPITMTHLMNHNAGFEDTVFQMSARDESELLSLGEALQVSEPHQVYRPGEITAYSNWSTALAGYVVEQISGQDFVEYVHEHIFEPLDMEETALAPDYSDNYWVKGQLLQNQGYSSTLAPIDDGLFYINLYPSGSAAGTLADFITFAKALLPAEDGGSLLFEEDSTLNEMLSPSLTYPGTDIDYINHGLWSHEFNVQTLGHGGNTMMYSSYLLIDPVSQLGMVIMTNQGNEVIYSFGLPELVFGESGMMITEGEEYSGDASRMAGLYYSTRTIHKGLGKMYLLSSLQPFIANEAGNLEISLFGLASIFAEEIAPNTLMITQQFGDLELNNIARYSEINGLKKMTSPYVETLEADFRIWLVVIVTFLFILAMIWSLLVLVVNLIRWLVQKIRRKPTGFDSFKGTQLRLSVTNLLLIANIIIVAQKMYSFEEPRSSLWINILISIIIAVLPLLYSIKLFKQWPQLQASKWQKASYVITLCMGLIVSLTVLVLEMYRY